MKVFKSKFFIAALAVFFLVVIYVDCRIAYQHFVKAFFSKTFLYAKNSTASLVSKNHALDTSLALANSPNTIRAVYMTGWSAGSKKYLAYLDDIFKKSQINAVVIDVKDYSGIVSYYTGAPLARQYKAYHAQIGDIDALITRLHSRGIYIIGRVVVFEDPMLAKNRPDLAIYDKDKTTDLTKPVLWENNDHLSWVDPASLQVWDYNIAIARDALLHGFDEINFDYVRFPTDGKADAMGFPVWDGKTPKHAVIKSFFEKLRQAFPGDTISADIFGQVTTNTDGMGIGQIFEDSLAYFDYIYPMVYPSHYAEGFLGYKNPADYPYEVIAHALSGAKDRRDVYVKTQSQLSNGATAFKVAKIRPWLQDFNLGADYTPDMVAQQIKAVGDVMGADYGGYMLWNPLNTYVGIDQIAPK